MKLPGALTIPGAIAAAAALVAGMVVSAGATSEAAPAALAATSGCTASGWYEVCLTDPPAGGQDRTIVNRLREMVQKTEPGDSIRVAMYTWTLDGIAQDLVAAHGRNVDVDIVIDDAAAAQDAYDILKAGGVPVTVCNGGCLSGDHITHTKFFLFDWENNNAVVQTSSNLTSHMLTRNNDMIKIMNNAQVFDFYQDYFARMKRKSWTVGGDTWTDEDKSRNGGKVKAYAFPRTSGDPILGILNNVTTCSADGDGDGDGDKKIWLAESLFTRPRAAVQNRLAYMEDVMGCSVKVIVAKDDHENWVQGTSSGGYNLGNNKVRKAPVHNKLIIIDAKYNGRWQETVFTGSHNLTSPSLRQNDETMLRIEHPFVFSQYRNYFDELYASATLN